MIISILQMRNLKLKLLKITQPPSIDYDSKVPALN